MIMRHHGLINLLLSNGSFVFISKFWSLYCYSLRIKKKLSTGFHPQTISKINSQSYIMKNYFKAFINYKQND